MSRWEPDARQRLERAALELFDEQGFAETTVPQITARAGLTTRTFFRHYADKREVLFAGEAELPEVIAGLFADAPAGDTPMQIVAHGLKALADSRFEGRREFVRQRRRFIQADEGLHERELRKLAVLSESLQRGFTDRGIDELTATLAARIAATAFSVSVDRWIGRDDGQPLSALIQDTLARFRSVTADLDAGRPQNSVPG